MGSTIIEIVEKLCSWWEARQESNKAARENVLRLAWTACHALVDVTDVHCDEARLLQERLRNLYENASTLFAGRLTGEELSVVITALGSARIYYWIKFLDGTGSEELEQLFEDDADRRTESGAALYYMIGRGNSTEDKLERARDVCLHDFGKLEALLQKHRL
jgi:hypothetical protein